MAVEMSIIVPCRGRASLLRACLDSLFSQITTTSYEVIVVYCETDHDVDAVIKNFELTRVIKSEIYLLPGSARNLGAEHAHADILGFIDSDCLVDSKWVSFAVETIKNGAVICSGAIKDSVPWNLLSSSDNRLQYADFPTGRPYGKALYFPGAHVAIRKNVFQQTNGFPDHSYGQDVIFSIQVAEHFPDRVIFNPELIVRHYGRSQWTDFLEHQRIFGRARAQDQIQINKTVAWLAKHPYFGWVLFLRRLIYISMRVLQWNFSDLPRYLLQLPILLIGLVYWVNGFYEGSAKENKTVSN
jgi:glycosyltransferase involved in cell wall biosynthesis